MVTKPGALCDLVIFSSQHLLDLSLDSIVTVSQIHCSSGLTEVADITLQAQVTVWPRHYLFFKCWWLRVGQY